MLRKTLIGLAASLALAAGASSALADFGTVFTYQGQLKNSGVLVNTATDMQFSLWNHPTLRAVENQVGDTITQTNVTVNNGLFTTGLEFGVNPYTSNQELWLQIGIGDPTGSGMYRSLVPAQKLTPAPFSLATRGINVDATSNVGIGTGAPDNLLHVESPTSPSIGLGRPGGERYEVGIATADGQFSESALNNDAIIRTRFDGRLHLQTGTGSAALTVDTNDNVGIGTDAPVFPLEVSGRMRVRASAATGSGGIWYTDDDSPETNRSFLGRAGSADRWTGVFSGTPGNPWPLIVKDSGNVGIGTINPYNLLDVADGAVVGSSRLVGTSASNDQGNRGTKVSFGWAYTDDCSASFNGMRVVVGPGTIAGCGSSFNSTDLTFWTGECGVSCPRENMRLSGAGNLGIGIVPVGLYRLQLPNFAGSSGRGIANRWDTYSSREFKQNIATLADPLDTLSKLRGVSFDWKTADEQGNHAHDIGFIAEEVNAVLPDIVAKDPDGKVTSLDYGRVVPVTVEAIKQLKNENDELKARLEKIEALLAAQAANDAK